MPPVPRQNEEPEVMIDLTDDGSDFGSLVAIADAVEDSAAEEPSAASEHGDENRKLAFITRHSNGANGSILSPKNINSVTNKPKFYSPIVSKKQGRTKVKSPPTRTEAKDGATPKNLERDDAKGDVLSTFGNQDVDVAVASSNESPKVKPSNESDFDDLALKVKVKGAVSVRRSCCRKLVSRDACGVNARLFRVPSCSHHSRSFLISLYTTQTLGDTSKAAKTSNGVVESSLEGEDGTLTAATTATNSSPRVTTATKTAARLSFVAPVARSRSSELVGYHVKQDTVGGTSRSMERVLGAVVGSPLVRTLFAAAASTPAKANISINLVDNATPQALVVQNGNALATNGFSNGFVSPMAQAGNGVATTGLLSPIAGVRNRAGLLEGTNSNDDQLVWRPLQP